MQCLFEKLSEGGVQGELRIFLNFLSTPLTSTNELWKTFPWGNVIEAWGVTIFTFHLFETVFNWKRKTESKSGGSVCPAGNSSLGTRGLDPKRRRDHPHPPRDRQPPPPEDATCLSPPITFALSQEPSHAMYIQEEKLRYLHLLCKPASSSSGCLWGEAALDD